MVELLPRTKCPDTPDGLSAQTGGGHTLSIESVRPSVRPPREQRKEKARCTRAERLYATLRAASL
jgi:hypothetical protein